jgi:hypothetical protein
MRLTTDPLKREGKWELVQDLLKFTGVRPQPEPPKPAEEKATILTTVYQVLSGK